MVSKYNNLKILYFLEKEFLREPNQHFYAAENQETVPLETLLRVHPEQIYVLSFVAD